MTTLALVTIGRNPGADLPRLLATAALYPFHEVVFVDSGSTDGSGAVASAAGARVVTLPASVPGAAAARAAGTLAVAAEWILYLDSDMVPDIAAVSRIHGLLRCQSGRTAGITGITRDRYPNGTCREHHTRQNSGDRATYFGGAVVLRRSAVLRAGNWNSRVFANEELDLHARIRSLGTYVRFERIVLVDHHTALIGTAEKFARLVNWNGRAGPRFGAPGAALRSAVSVGAGLQLIRLSPEPFLTVPYTVVSLVIAMTGNPWLGAAMLLVIWAWIGWRRGVRYLVPSYLLFPHAILGAARYGKR